MTPRCPDCHAPRIAVINRRPDGQDFTEEFFHCLSTVDTHDDGRRFYWRGDKCNPGPASKELEGVNNEQRLEKRR